MGASTTTPRDEDAIQALGIPISADMEPRGVMKSPGYFSFILHLFQRYDFDVLGLDNCGQVIANITKTLYRAEIGFEELDIKQHAVKNQVRTSLYSSSALCNLIINNVSYLSRPNSVMGSIS